MDNKLIENDKEINNIFYNIKKILCLFSNYDNSVVAILIIIYRSIEYKKIDKWHNHLSIFINKTSWF